MKLIKTINNNTTEKAALKEDAAGGAVGSGAVAMCAMPLFASMVKRTAPKVKVIKWSTKKKAKKPSIGLKEAFNKLYEFAGETGGMSTNMDGSPIKGNASNSFDPTSVIAKLKGLENKERQDHRNTVSFGLEDENGGIVRVTVSSEQAEDFEKSLQAFLADQEREEDAVPEIAEVLFKLKDRFDIVDVQWPEVQEDEEEEVGLDGQTPDGAEGAGDMELGGDQADPAMDPAAPPAGADEGQVKDLLVQVIDMMKADAEARKAEARAREEEAKSKQADNVVKQTMNKVKQEEQFLDMETYNKARKEEEREAKRLAQLAKWKHDMAKDEGITDDDDFGGDDVESAITAPAPDDAQAVPPRAPREEEERSTLRRPPAVKAQPATKPAKVIRGRVHPHDIASFILSRVK